MLPTVQFYSSLIIKEPTLSTASNGAEYYRFTVQTSTKKDSVGACIFCYKNNPLFNEVAKLKKDMYVNMVCTLATREAPAINANLWRAMIGVLKKIHITDKFLSDYIRGCTLDVPKKDCNYFNVVAIDIDYSRVRSDFKRNNNVTRNQQQQQIPEKPLTMEGF